MSVTDAMAATAPPATEPTTPPTGLTTVEVAARRAQGLGNTVTDRSSRTWSEIVRDNVLTFLNVTLFGVGIALVALGLPKDAILSSGFALLNASIGVLQEAIAKRRLDRIALLTRVRAAAVRDGAEVNFDPAELVVGDLLVLRPGDQVALDGIVTVDGALEMDESLLSGESDAIHKDPGDPVYAGSYCLAGSGRYVATATGPHSRASAIQTDARRFRVTLTPLQQQVNTIVRLLIVAATTMLGMLVLSSLVWGNPLRETVVAAAVVLGIIPSGLFVMVTVTYSMAALRLASRNVLIQQVNAVESLSNVDVFCMDKTGTLTTNTLVLAEVRPIDRDADDVRRTLGAIAHSARARNRTTEALAMACPGPALVPTGEIPFASSRKWSALALDDDAVRGTWALGAPEMLGPLLAMPPGDIPPEWLAGGLRVLLLAGSPQPHPLHDDAGNPALPHDLAPIAWIALTDELRPHVDQLLARFREAGIRLKVISGDHPETVAALARQAGLAGDAGLVSGLELDTLDEAGMARIATSGTVFGRITPEQKARLIDALKATGAYVAMTGDGVNDVMSLKRANLGIAMESGSQATRAAADLVLLGDTFAALPAAFLEGQRVRRGLEGVMSLFLTRVLVVTLALLLCAVVRVGFPFSPGDMTLLTLLTVGIPTFGIALWAHPGQPDRSLVRSLVAFVAPAAFTLGLAAFAVYLAFYLGRVVEVDELRSGGAAVVLLENPVARDALTYLLILAGLALVPFACPPTAWWAVREPSDGDRRPALLALAMLPLYALIVLVPGPRGFFGTHLLTAWEYLTIALVAVGWVFGVRWVWKERLLERLLGWPRE